MITALDLNLSKQIGENLNKFSSKTCFLSMKAFPGIDQSAGLSPAYAFWGNINDLEEAGGW
jgi:hypothetical protein